MVFFLFKQVNDTNMNLLTSLLKNTLKSIRWFATTKQISSNAKFVIIVVIAMICYASCQDSSDPQPQRTTKHTEKPKSKPKYKTEKQKRDEYVKRTLKRINESVKEEDFTDLKTKDGSQVRREQYHKKIFWDYARREKKYADWIKANPHLLPENAPSSVKDYPQQIIDKYSLTEKEYVDIVAKGYMPWRKEFNVNPDKY